MDGSGSGLRRGVGVTEVLAHFGVKGMKWGVVRSKTSSGPPSSEDSTRTTAIRTSVRKSGVRVASNKQLEEAIRRMQLERQYKELSPTAKQRVLGFLGKVLVETGKQEAKKAATDFTTKQVAKALKK